MLHDASARPPGQGQASATRHTYSSLRKAKAKQESGQDGDLDVERDRYSEQGKPNAVRVALRDMPVILPVRKHIENPDSASGLKGPGARTTGEKKHEFTLEVDVPAQGLEHLVLGGAQGLDGALSLNRGHR